MQRKLLSLLVALAASPAFGADLLQVYRDALGYDAQYASAKAQRDAGREREPQGLAGLLPSLSASANTTWNDLESKPRSATAALTQTDRRFNSNGYTLTLSQPVFRWQNVVAYDQAKLAVLQAQAAFAQAGQDLIVRVAQAYFDVLLAQDSLALAQAQKTAIGEQLEAAKRNFEVGTSTIVDVHEAQSRFDQASAQEITARNDLEIRRQALRQVTGKLPESLKALRADVQLQRPQPDDMNQWVEASEQGSPQVAVQQAALGIATKEIARQRAGHYPTLDVVATYGKSATGFSSATLGGVDQTAATVGLQLGVPLYAGGAVVSREREAVALRERADSDLENVRRTVALTARQSYLGVTNGLAQVKALEQAVVSSQSSLDSNKLGYEVGVRINIDVLNAQQQLFQTRRDLARARYDTLLAQLRLKAAAGRLGEDDVQAVNALLER
jgi:outer membrane protein